MIRDKVKQQFVKEVLQEEGRNILEERLKMIAKKRINVTKGWSPLKNETKKEIKSGDFDGSLSIMHVNYQRFLDMKFRGSKRKKKFPIHNKIIFGHLNNISYKLMYYFTEDIAQRIKRDFESGKIKI